MRPIGGEALFHLFNTRARRAADSFTRESWRCKHRLADEFNILPGIVAEKYPPGIAQHWVGVSKEALCGRNSPPAGPTASNNILYRSPAFFAGWTEGCSWRILWCTKLLKGRGLVGATGFEPATSCAQGIGTFGSELPPNHTRIRSYAPSVYIPARPM